MDFQTIVETIIFSVAMIAAAIQLMKIIPVLVLKHLAPHKADVKVIVPFYCLL